MRTAVPGRNRPFLSLREQWWSHALEHYGAPNEVTPTKLFWYRGGPWARMELTADQVLHNFPTPHTDYLTRYVDYPVPANKASDH